MALPLRDDDYDSEWERQEEARNHLRSIDGGGEGDGVPRGLLHTVGDSSSTGNLKDKEANFAPSLFEDVEDKHFAKGSMKQRRRRALFFIFSTTGVSGLFFSFFTLLGQPLQIIHFAETLKSFHLDHIEELSDMRHMRRIRNFGDPTDKARRRRLGVVGNRLANHIEAEWKQKGVELDYDKSTGRLKGFKLDNESAKNAFVRQGHCQRPCDYVEAFEDIWRLRGKNRLLFEDLQRSLGTRGFALNAKQWVINKRYGINRKPFSGIKNKIENIDNASRARARNKAIEWRDKYERRIKKQSTGGIRRVDGLEDIDENDSDAAKRAKVKNALRVRGGDATDVFVILCTVRQLAKVAASEDVRALIKSTLVIGQTVLAMGDQVKTGDFVIEELEEFGTKQFYGQNPEDDRDTSWVEADDIRQQTGSGVDGIVPTEQYEKYTLNAQGNAIDDAFESFPDVVGGTLGGICDAVLSFIGGLLLDVAGLFFRLTGVGSIAAGELFNFLAGDAIAGAVVGALASDPFPEDATGALLGYGADIGTFHMANHLTANMGGVPLTEDEESERIRETREQSVYNFQNESFATRYFDIHNIDSFSAQLAMKTYTLDPQTTNVRSSIGTVIGNIFSSPLQIFGSRQARAIGGNSVTEEYFQTPRYGFSYEALTSPEFDPRSPDGWPLPDGQIVANLETVLSEKVSAEANRASGLLCNEFTQYCINPGLTGDAAIDVLNNNMNPAPIGYFSTGNYLDSWHADCMGAIAYDNVDLYGGQTRWFARDDDEWLVATIKGESLRPEECDTGQGIKVRINADPEYRSGATENWSVNSVEIELDEQDWLLYRAYAFVSAMITGEGCALSTIDREELDGTFTEYTDATLEQLCQENGFYSDIGTTDEQIKEFAKLWGRDRLESIDPDKIFDNNTPVGDIGAVFGDHNIPCDAGTQSSVVGSNPFGGGAAATFNVCDLGNGIVVNSSISGPIAQLIAAARADGVILTATSSLRTRAEQEYLYNCFLTGACNNGNLAARPGFSNHEAGMAIDFNRPSIAWLQNNMDFVRQIGLSADVASEDWHFSVNGR